MHTSLLFKKTRIIYVLTSIPQVARDELEREDVARELNVLYPEATLALQAQAEKAQKLKAKGIKQRNGDNDGVVSVAEDEVRTRNRQVHAAHVCSGLQLLPISIYPKIGLRHAHSCTSGALHFNLTRVHSLFANW